jgi:hypothetical protein
MIIENSSNENNSFNGKIPDKFDYNINKYEFIN